MYIGGPVSEDRSCTSVGSLAWVADNRADRRLGSPVIDGCRGLQQKRSWRCDAGGGKAAKGDGGKPAAFDQSMYTSCNVVGRLRASGLSERVASSGSQSRGGKRAGEIGLSPEHMQSTLPASPFVHATPAAFFSPIVHAWFAGRHGPAPWEWRSPGTTPDAVALLGPPCPRVGKGI